MKILLAVVLFSVVQFAESLAKVADVSVVVDRLSDVDVSDDIIQFKASGIAKLFIVTSNDETAKSKWVSGGRPAGFVKIAARDCAFTVHFPSHIRDPLVDQRQKWEQAIGLIRNFKNGDQLQISVPRCQMVIDDNVIKEINGTGLSVQKK
jgi:hypothetical protein